MLNLPDAELIALFERHSDSLEAAARLVLPRPIRADQDIEVQRERFALIMFGALLALGLPKDEAQLLAIEVALLIFRNHLRMQHPAGNA